MTTFRIPKFRYHIKERTEPYDKAPLGWRERKPAATINWTISD